MRRLAVAVAACVAVIGGGHVAARQAKVLEPAALEDLLPSTGPAGFVRRAPQGQVNETPGMGRVSRAEVSFQTRDQVPKTIRVSIVDFAEHSMRAMILQGTVHPGASQSATGYEKGVTVKDRYPGKEMVERMRQECGVSFVVGDRFIVEVPGQWVDVQDLYDVIGRMPLERLEKVSQSPASHAWSSYGASTNALGEER